MDILEKRKLTLDILDTKGVEIFKSYKTIKILKF